MFTEELGSRLRGIGYTVHPYDNPGDLAERLSRANYPVELVIIDLQHTSSGGLAAIAKVKEQHIPVLALGEHKKTEMLQAARDAGADRVIINSQASDNIERYVSQLLT